MVDENTDGHSQIPELSCYIMKDRAQNHVKFVGKTLPFNVQCIWRSSDCDVLWKIDRVNLKLLRTNRLYNQTSSNSVYPYSLHCVTYYGYVTLKMMPIFGPRLSR